ncbi:ABC transporter substrate-binding protein [Nitriliruptor alkaliphilus]|uniref:ABC transporter substrate-binding protein n=1 Tax=Nitriliruptor alkaliphilus TaxID=427918 RepID=UPI0006967850|nr:ABC transporter substrate-binding protein [Nitriliruptor alkaliphilus]
MAGGNWAAELVEAAGAEPVLGVRGGHSPIVTPAELTAADPDVIIVAPCGYDLARAEQEAPLLASIDGWRDMSAVRAGRVAFVDGSAYVNRPGPRLVDTAQILAAIAHGQGPAVDLEGTAWTWLADHG